MTKQNTHTHTSGALALSIMAGWTPAPQETGLSAADLWEITAAALRASGVSNPRPAPSSNLGGAR